MSIQYLIDENVTPFYKRQLLSMKEQASLTSLRELPHKIITTS